MPIPGYDPASCELFISSCDKRLSADELFKAIIGVDENGCPVLKTKASIAFSSVERTPALIRVIDLGVIPAGARKVDVFNSGDADGIFLGSVLKPGESIPYQAGGQNDTLGAFEYDATGTEFVISTIF